MSSQLGHNGPLEARQLGPNVPLEARLRRLLALNPQRAAEEKDKTPDKPAKPGRKPKKSERQGEMFG